MEYDCKEKDDEDENHNCQGKQRLVSDDIYSLSDYAIIQLNLFAFNRATQNQAKLTPTIEVNKQINIVGTNMDLSAIVFHCGESLTVGHYT